MKKPEMIMFDIGDTLIRDGKPDYISGINKILEFSKNPDNVKADEIQNMAVSMNEDFGRDVEDSIDTIIEVPNSQFFRFLYEYFNIEFLKSADEIEKLFYDSINNFQKTDGIIDFLKFLRDSNIRTGIISNAGVSGWILKQEIQDQFSNHDFEFVIVTSDYAYRKPNKRIFELALRKARLSGDKAFYAGDKYNKDVIGAAGAGIYPIWYKGSINREKVGNIDIDHFEAKSWDDLRLFIENKF
ncbi:MAG: HAD-IA family hydrolase [Clostridiales bacterium]